MKKLILLVLSLAMVISLCACGGSGETPNNNGTTTLVEENTGTQNQTMDELLSSAIRLDNDSFLKECSSNIAKASNDYEGKPCIVEGFISEIQKDHIVLYYSYLHLNVYIPTEQILELQTEQYIEVVGTLENLTYDMYSGAFADLTTAYVSKDTFTIVGEYYYYNSTDGTHPQDACLKLTEVSNIQCIDDSKVEYIGLDKKDEQLKTLENGSVITVEGKLLNNYWDNTPNKTAYIMIDIIIK